MNDINIQCAGGWSGGTRYRDMARPRALIVLCATMFATALGLWIAVAGQVGPLAPPADGAKRDALLFRAVADRVHAGEGYYEAFGSELRSRGYPTRSVFNWRLPLFAWLNGKLPNLLWGQALLSALALSAVLMVYQAVRAESGVATAMATVVLVGLALAPCLRPNIFLTTELWAGTLIMLSIAAYALGWRGLGVVAGLFALFFRELALPYGLISLALAFRQGRRREVLAWIAGLALFAAYLALHAMEVVRHQTATDLGHEQGWVRFGGVEFLLTTVGIHILLAEFPRWTWAVYLPLSVLGLASWRGEMGTRVALTAGTYLAAFAVVGQAFNNYWGLIDAPLLALGFVRSPASLRDLIRSSRGTGASAGPSASSTPVDSDLVASSCDMTPAGRKPDVLAARVPATRVVPDRPRL